MIVDLSTLHTETDENLIDMTDQLNEDLHDGSHLTEACFNMLTAIRSTIDAELSIRGLDRVIKNGSTDLIFS